MSATKSFDGRLHALLFRVSRYEVLEITNRMKLKYVGALVVQIYSTVYSTSDHWSDKAAHPRGAALLCLSL